MTGIRNRVIFCLIICRFFSFSSFVLAESENLTASSSRITPSDAPSEPSAEKTQDTDKKEQYENITKKAGWTGLGGLISMLIADELRYPYVRTLANGVTGLAWAAALGAYGISAESTIETPTKDQLTADSDRHFVRASNQGAIGESSNLFLIPEGLYIHPIYNDVNGNTDKLLTASFKLGLLRSWETSSLETTAYWRLLTPSVKQEFNTDDMEKPVGRYADWIELKSSWADIWDLETIKLRSQISLGLNHIGNKGGRNFHVAVHQLTKNSLDNLEYTNQPEGRFLTTGLELGIMHPIYSGSLGVAKGLLAISGEHSKMMRELGPRWSLVHVVYPGLWEYAIEIRALRQFLSEVYYDIRPYRFEGAIGVRILRNFTPTLKYVSPYLRGDRIGQTYFDLLHYNVMF